MEAAYIQKEMSDCVTRTCSINFEIPISAQHIQSDKLPVKPFLKWAGGKAQILTKIREKYPVELGKTLTKYAEPFIGGGAILFDVLSNYNMESVYISDINQELISTYICIRDNIEDLIFLLHNLAKEHLELSSENRKEYYYAKRKEFNDLKQNAVRDTRIAALFIYLNKTCFNGLYRVNKKGDFNVPVGDYKRPNICDANNLRAISSQLQKVKIVMGDYKLSDSFIDEKTFAYFDPPYRPISSTSSFTSYTEGDFDDTKQTELALFIRKMSKKGAFIIASNSDPKNTDKNDNFFDTLYDSLTIERISANRMINSIAEKRGRLNELLIFSSGYVNK